MMKPLYTEVFTIKTQRKPTYFSRGSCQENLKEKPKDEFCPF